MVTTRTRTLLTGSTVAMLMATGSAYAQDATIYYETPTIQSGQPVVNPVPIITPVPVYTPVAVDATAGAEPLAAPSTMDNASSYLVTPIVQTSSSDASTTFVSGGIGAFEKQWFNDHTSDFNLKVSYNDATGHNLAGVGATLIDSTKNIVLTATTEGPYLLVKTKPGTYTLTSVYEGVSKSKKITVGKGTARTSVIFPNTNPDM